MLKFIWLMVVPIISTRNGTIARAAGGFEGDGSKARATDGGGGVVSRWPLRIPVLQAWGPNVFDQGLAQTLRMRKNGRASG